MIQSSVCQFELKSNFKCNPNSYGAISIVLFRSHSRGAKNFKGYALGLDYWLSFVFPKYFHMFKLLLFLDETSMNDKYIAKLINKYKSDNKFIINLFECSEFVDPTTHLHIDLFGTLIRFIPFFDFENSNCYGKRIISIDVEPSKYIYNCLNTLIKVDNEYSLSSLGKKNPLDIIYYGIAKLNVIDKETNFRIIRKTNLPYALASNICVKTKLPKDILINFLKNHHYVENLTWVYGALTTAYDRGVDELFINQILIPECQRLNYRIGYYYYFTIVEGLYYYKDQLMTNKDTHKILQYIYSGNKKPSVEMTVDQLFIILDQMFYYEYKDDKFHQDVTKRFWKIINELIKKKKEWLSLEYMKNIKSLFENLSVFNGLIIYKGYKLEQIYQVKYKDEKYFIFKI